MDVVEARAWMEGQREVEIAERLILKPDSVLEYSCFDDLLNKLGVGANTMFSDNIFSTALFTLHPATAPRPAIGGVTPQTPLNLGPNYANPPVSPRQLFQTGLDSDLSQVVYDPMFQFLVQSFAHVYAGGTYTSASAGSSSACNPMQAVWDFVKCQDFDKNLFRTFQQMALLDPRDMPTPCGDPNHSTNWINMMTAAYPPPASPTSPGGIDIIPTSAKMYNPVLSNLSGCSAAGPVPTGIQVTAGGSTYPDAVCPVPGCYYGGSGGSCTAIP